MIDRLMTTVALALEAAAVVLLAVLALRPPPPAVVVTCPPAAPPAVTTPAPGPDVPKGQVSPDPPTWTPGAARRGDVRGALRALAVDLRRGAFGRDELARRVDWLALALEPPAK